MEEEDEEEEVYVIVSVEGLENLGVAPSFGEVTIKASLAQGATLRPGS